MKHSERFALNEWLSDYPKELEYQDIIDLIRAEDDSVVAWELVEFMPPYTLIDCLEMTRKHFESTVDDLLWGVPLANLTEEETQAEMEARG